MNRDEWFDIASQTAGLLSILPRLPESASKRSFRIQLDKLYRLLMEEDERTGAPVKLLGGGSSLSGVSLKKARKRIGRHAARISHQTRTVRELTDKYFKEILRRGNPKLTNAEYRTWKVKLDATMAEQSKRARVEAMQRVESTLKAQPSIKSPKLS